MQSVHFVSELIRLRVWVGDGLCKRTVRTIHLFKYESEYIYPAVGDDDIAPPLFSNVCTVGRHGSIRE